MPFHVKALQLGMVGNFLSLIKGAFETLQLTLYFMMKDWLSPKIRKEKKQECLLLPLLSDTVLEILARAVTQGKKEKPSRLERKMNKYGVFAYVIVLYMNNPKKMNIQKSFIYI